MKHFWLLGLTVAVAAGCSQQEVRSFEGKAEGEYVRVAVPMSGNLARLGAKRGSAVRAGEMLFSLDDRKESAAHRTVEDRLQRVRASLEQARRGQSAAAIESAEAALNALQAELAQTEWRLGQKNVKAPREGLIVETLYDEGEWVPAGSAVLSMLAPDSMKVRFYVPPHVAGGLRHGQTVELRCAGCEPGTSARIVYVSPIAERKEDAVSGSLRFMVEADPAGDAFAQLRPGHAVEVVL